MKIYNHKGMTLVEILIALSILSIIAISLLSVFSSSYSNIFSFGRKSKAAMEAQALIEKIYERSTQSSLTTQLEVQDMVSSVLSMNGYSADQYKLSSSDSSLSSLEGTEYIRYYIFPETSQSGIQGFEVQLLVFYSSGKSSVSLATFIIKGGS